MIRRYMFTGIHRSRIIGVRKRQTREDAISTMGGRRKLHHQTKPGNDDDDYLKNIRCSKCSGLIEEGEEIVSRTGTNSTCNVRSKYYHYRCARILNIV